MDKTKFIAWLDHEINYWDDVMKKYVNNEKEQDLYHEAVKTRTYYRVIKRKVIRGIFDKKEVR